MVDIPKSLIRSNINKATYMNQTNLKSNVVLKDTHKIHNYYVLEKSTFNTVEYQRA